MSARDDYPILASVATDAQLFCWTEARAALDELEALRPVVTAALAWKQTKYAQHGNTSDSSRKHALAVQWAERHLADKIADFVAATA